MEDKRKQENEAEKKESDRKEENNRKSNMREKEDRRWQEQWEKEFIDSREQKREVKSSQETKEKETLERKTAQEESRLRELMGGQAWLNPNMPAFPNFTGAGWMERTRQRGQDNGHLEQVETTTKLTWTPDDSVKVKASGGGLGSLATQLVGMLQGGQSVGEGEPLGPPIQADLTMAVEKLQ